MIFLHILCECSETGKASVFRYVFPNWLPVSIIFAEKGNRSCKAEPVPFPIRQKHSRFSGGFAEIQTNFLCSIYIIQLIWYNKIDRDGARPAEVIDELLDLFIELGADEDQLDFPVVYASGRDGYASLDPEARDGDMKPLFEAILTLRSPEECYAFFKDLCTYQELNAMAQRLQVAKMLHEGHVFHEIVEETGASTATISRVNRAIKDGCDGYQIIFDRTEKTEEK